LRLLLSGTDNQTGPFDVFALRDDTKRQRRVRRGGAQSLVDLSRRVNTLFANAPDRVARLHLNLPERTRRSDRLDHHASSANKIKRAVNRSRAARQNQHRHEQERRSFRHHCSRQVKEKDHPRSLQLGDTDAGLSGEE
jgi:hypothetical protein